MGSGESEISRVRRTRQEAQKTYDKISRWYDYLEGFWEKRLRERGLAKLKVQEGEVVLEIGFGPGHDLVSMAKSVGAEGKVHGIDLSPKMIATTNNRVSAAGIADRVSLGQGDAVHLPYQNDFFDAIFMSFTLELFDTPEIPWVLVECRRVLRTAGRLGVVSLSKAPGVNIMVSLYEWGHARFPKFLDCRPIFLRRAMEAAKFEIQDYLQESLFGLPVEIAVGCKIL
jgi:ubiquinone/menaquinone biosynthesis C-methylase UbiE